MDYGIEKAKVLEVVRLLTGIEPDKQLLQLKNLCQNNNGTWAVPERPEDYKPALYEVSLLGVFDDETTPQAG